MPPLSSHSTHLPLLPHSPHYPLSFLPTHQSIPTLHPLLSLYTATLPTPAVPTPSTNTPRTVASCNQGKRADKPAVAQLPLFRIRRHRSIHPQLRGRPIAATHTRPLQGVGNRVSTRRRHPSAIHAGRTKFVQCFTCWQ